MIYPSSSVLAVYAIPTPFSLSYIIVQTLKLSYIVLPYLYVVIEVICGTLYYKTLLLYLYRPGRFPFPITRAPFPLYLLGSLHPLANSHTKTVILAFMQNWIAQFGAPKFVTTDCCPRFEFTVFFKLRIPGLRAHSNNCVSPSLQRNGEAFAVLA